MKAVSNPPTLLQAQLEHSPLLGPLPGFQLTSNVPLVWYKPSPHPGASQGTMTHNPWTVKMSRQALAAQPHSGAQQVQSELLPGNKDL